jgi:hypothetical protein
MSNNIHPFEEKQEEGNANDKFNLFSLLLYSHLVSNLMENKLTSLWGRMDSETVTQICDIIGTGEQNESGGWSVPRTILSGVSRNTSLNIHQVTEDQLIKILKCFHHQAFCDRSIEMVSLTIE